MFDKRMLQKAYDWCSDNASDWGDEHMRVAAMCIKSKFPDGLKILKQMLTELQATIARNVAAKYSKKMILIVRIVGRR